MIKLNKNQANNLYDLLVIMNSVVNANSRIFNPSIKEAVKTGVNTLKLKIIAENKPKRKHIHAEGDKGLK